MTAPTPVMSLNSSGVIDILQLRAEHQGKTELADDITNLRSSLLHNFIDLTFGGGNPPLTLIVLRPGPWCDRPDSRDGRDN